MYEKRIKYLQSYFNPNRLLEMMLLATRSKFVSRNAFTRSVSSCGNELSYNQANFRSTRLLQ